MATKALTKIFVAVVCNTPLVKLTSSTVTSNSAKTVSISAKIRSIPLIFIRPQIAALLLLELIDEAKEHTEKMVATNTGDYSVATNMAGFNGVARRRTCRCASYALKDGKPVEVEENQS